MFETKYWNYYLEADSCLGMRGPLGPTGPLSVRDWPNCLNQLAKLWLLLEALLPVFVAHAELGSDR